MERPAWAPRSIDISVPSVSRIYDFYLGGSHNFEVDREAARKAMEFMPGLPKIMQANRAFMRRAVRFAAWATSCTLPKVGMPDPMSRNWSMPSPTAKRTARRMNARFACMILGSPGMCPMALRAASRSTSKLWEPPR